MEARIDALVPISESCIGQVHAFALSRGAEFWVGRRNPLKLFTANWDTGLVAALLRCASEMRDGPTDRLLVIDVGAAMHGISLHTQLTGNRLHSDDSDSLWLLGGLQQHGEVHAFEPNADAAAALLRAARTRSYTKRNSELFHVHTVGVGAVDTNEACFVHGGGRQPNRARMHFDGCGSGHREMANVTTLDRFVGRRRIAYAKVDVEGDEWAVVDGMAGLLRSQRVDAASFEYGVGWERAFGGKTYVPLDAVHARALNHTLDKFVARLDAFGYDTYLLHGRPVTLVPIFGPFWTPALEICADRRRFYGTTKLHCWNDLLVVRRGNKCLRNAILESTNGLSGDRAQRKIERAFPACPVQCC